MRHFFLAFLAVFGLLGLSGFSAAQTPTTISQTSPATTQWTYGVTPITLQVTAQDGSVPNGLVSYSVDSGPFYGLGPIDGNGLLNTSISPIDVGNHTLSFQFAGGAPYENSIFSEQVTISPDSLTISISTTQTSFVYGAGGPQVQVTVSGGAHSGILSLYADGVNLAALAPFTQNTAIFGTETIPPGGMHNLYVVFQPNGNTDTLSAQSNSIPITVAQATPNMVPSGAPNPVQFGNSANITLQMTEPSTWQASLPTGTIDFSEGLTDYGTVQLNPISSYATVQIPNLAVGQHTITATYSGDGNFSPSSTTYVENVLPVQVQTTTSLSTDQLSYVYGQPVQATVTLTSGYGTPSGTVVIDNGSTQVGVAALSNGQAVITVQGLTLGYTDLVAIYQPTGTFAQSSSQTVQVGVFQAPTSLQINAPSSLTYGQAAAFTVAVSGLYGGTPTGSVIASDGTNNYGPFTVVNGTAACVFVPLKTGAEVLTFSYSGDSNYLQSSGNVNAVVAKAVAQITLSNLNQTYSGQAESVTVGTNPNAAYTVTYNGSTNAPVNAGSYPVVVTITDPNYTGSMSGVLVISPVKLTITVNNASKYLHAANPTFTGTVNGLISSDGITVSYVSSATTQSDVGTYPITANISDPNSKLTNYTLTNTPGTLTITYAGNSGLIGEFSGGSTTWLSILPLPLIFEVYDANHNAVTTNGVISDVRIISINGAPANKEGQLSGSSGWLVVAGYWVDLMNVSSLTPGTTYGFEVILKDGSTLKFTATTEKL